MISFHLQGNVDRWPEAVAQLPDNTLLKVVDGVQRCTEAKAANPGCYTIVRHFVQEQNPQGDFHQHARNFFAMFVDESFRKIAWAVNAVSEYNEYLANSQDEEERSKWIAWASACVDVWRDEYRTQADYAHIELVLADAAIGNDIPLGFAKLSHDNPWVILSYHAYVPVWKGDIRPDDWLYYSGRWEEMDKRYRRLGYTVRWMMGEHGAVGHNGPGWPNSLAANDGWKHPDVYNGDLAAYIDMMRYWMDRTVETQAWQDGRVIGAVIFTSGGGSRWEHFELAQPDMGVVAEAVNNYMTNVPPTDPPIEPPDTDWQAELWAESVRLQTIELNPNAALQASIYNDGYVPVESEFWYTIGDIQYAAQAAETLDSGRRRVYYTTVPDWGDVRWFTEGSDVPVEIVDIVDQLPIHATKVYNTRSLDSITDLIIHHTVSPDERTSAQIATYHVSGKGWPGIGYHFVIGADGTIEQVNRLETMSYHASAANGYSVGIALKGDFTTEHPTDAQLESARWLINWLGDEALDNVEIVYGHREAEGAATQCPGNSWPEWKNEVIYPEQIIIYNPSCQQTQVTGRR